MALLRSWLPRRSRPALLRALRATIVVAGLFALCQEAIGNVQMATFAAFGGFATLVLSSFQGTRRDRLLAHAALAVVGSVLLSIGTAVSSSTLLAALVTVPVTFLVFFTGVTGPNAASGAFGAMLAYVLPAASPGTLSMIPDRLAGWWLASVAGTAAVLLVQAPSPAGALRGAVSRAALAIAAEIDAALRGDRDEHALRDCVSAKDELMSVFNATPYRPLGLAAPDQALADVVELLEWCSTLVVDAVREQHDLAGAGAADRELLEVSAEVLRDTADLFAGARAMPDLDRLDRCREQSLRAAARLEPGAPGFERDAQISFHAHAIAVAVLAAGAEALVAERLADVHEVERRLRRFATPAALPERARRAPRLRRAAVLASRHASVRSVWFINSLRAAVALAAAVAIADVSSVQHGFWVVLGTLSVLRASASATGATALRALGGTALGFFLGGALLLAVGANSTALWLVLPAAIFVAAYAPGTAPFVVGQAAFTVMVGVLFNLLAPVGWKVGVLRVEDVAIGCGVSLLVGCLLWPRGVAAVVADDLADAFRSGAAFLHQAVLWAAGRREDEPDLAPVATTAALRLDDALRGLLADQGTKRISEQELWRLVGGTLRLRLTAYAVARLPPEPGALSDAHGPLERRSALLVAFYMRLAELLDTSRGDVPPALELPTFGPDTVVHAGSGSRYAVWLCEHLDHLAEHLDELSAPAVRVARLRRQPWWR
ncbi:MAG TPA: FUSC family protein [Solirubrobacteraceae bacterium]